MAPPPGTTENGEKKLNERKFSGKKSINLIN